MGLQIRLRHALGARIMEVEGRGVDRPISIGRSGECAIQVPSGAVSPVHAYLYVHDGQWVIADAGSDAGTFVNGHRLSEPAMIQPGDVVSLGMGAAAPSIEIDPLGSARRVSSPRPSSPHEIAEEPLAQMPGAEEVPENAAEEAEAGADGGWAVESPAAPAEQNWSWEAAPAASYRRAPRRKKQSSAPIIVFLGGIVVVVGGVVIYRASHQDEPAGPGPAVSQPQPVQEEPAVSQRKPKKNIFDEPARPVRQPRPKAQQATMPAAVVPKASHEALAAPPDPRKQTEEWKNVAAAHDGDDPVHAIWTASDYMKLHPGQFDDELHGYIAEALDLLWWKRIKDLCNERERIDKELDQNSADISAESPGSDFLKTLREKRMELQFQKNAILDILANDMGYTASETPNPFDDAQIAKLRGLRDKAKYEAWSKRVLSSIQRTREAPWVRAR